LYLHELLRHNYDQALTDQSADYVAVRVKSEWVA